MNCSVERERTNEAVQSGSSVLILWFNDCRFGLPFRVILFSRLKTSDWKSTPSRSLSKTTEMKAVAALPGVHF